MGSFCKCKSYPHFFSKNISLYAILNDQNFNNTFTKDIVSFEQLGPEVLKLESQLGHMAFAEINNKIISCTPVKEILDITLG